ncbi:hypothetical protein [Ktedonospora formicarum]|uniref:Uncharacterized protein n=1 Tax=Ktedonospora formicarum TaxID=2778364 RepID=A0A8J3I4R5_9CHLR|nr:hypothetical protein [Ktedonospora formicarum]GHO46147.1 hypothetical protein KSX_43100 [Ktedonospora formicarum]
MKELENIIAGAELNDAELELVSGRGDGGFGGGNGGFGGGYGGGKGGFVQGGRSDLRVVNNFSFRNNTNIGGIATIPITLSDFNCNSFGNTFIGGGDGF